MVKRNISLYKRKKEIITKARTLHERKSSYYEFFGWREHWYYGFLVVKGDLFQRRKLIERPFLKIYETYKIF